MDNIIKYSDKIIDCRKFVSDFKKDIIKEIISILQTFDKDKEIHVPTLVILKIGNDFASNKYIKNKEKVFSDLNMLSKVIEFPEDIEISEIFSIIDMLNRFNSVDGIMVQLPLPDRLKVYERAILDSINPDKDVDGLTSKNIGNLQIGTVRNIPCTARGIVELLKDYCNNSLQGKNAVVVGRSNIVGLPVANLLLKENCTVTVCHSKTENLKDICKNADILVVAIGKSNFINKNYVSDKTIVIDVGINRDENNKITGDVDFDDVLPYCKAITLVPGGVGLLTTTMLAYNTLLNWKFTYNGGC